MYKLKKEDKIDIENVGDLKKALENVPDYLPIEIGLDRSDQDGFYAGVYTHEDDEEDQYFGLEPN